MFHLLRSLFATKAGTDDTGSWGERLAAGWLTRERKFKVIARNWRSPKDRREEIDLVCRDGSALVFVEVKARVAGALVPGYHAIDRRKKRVLERAIKAYLAQLREKPRTFRLDVVEVSFDASAGGQAGRALDPVILHFENVPLFSKYYRG